MQQKLGLEKRGVQIRHLKARLINSFGNSDCLFSKFSGTARKNLQQKENESSKTSWSCRNIEKGRKDSWPPSGQELPTRNFEVPFFTEALLLSILTSSNKKTERISRIINSFSQDLIYSVSFGKKGYQNMSNSASQ